MSNRGRAELRPGRYFGAIGGRSETPLAVLSEVIHPDARELPLHDHALAYFCMLVQGGYAETIAGRALEYAPFQVGFHPARMPHRDRVGMRGARFLCLEIRPRSLDAFAVKLSAARALLPGDVTLQMLRLCDAMTSGTLSPIVLDSVAWELCGDAGNTRLSVERQRPRWLERCLELVDDAHGEALTVAGVAHAVEPLAAIAARCGFADRATSDASSGRWWAARPPGSAPRWRVTAWRHGIPCSAPSAAHCPLRSRATRCAAPGRCRTLARLR
jgi:hypothetical protein